ncbi:MAG: hypothetical protein ACRDJE_13195 [Dehalococcoidia bacterium]
MTQLTEERREQLRAAGTQAAAKLEAFNDGLTIDERFVLGLAVWKVMAEKAAANESVAGFAVNIAERNPVGKFVVDVFRTIGIGVGIDVVERTVGAIADSVGSGIPDRLPTSGLGGPMGAGGRRGP